MVALACSFVACSLVLVFAFDLVTPDTDNEPVICSVAVPIGRTRDHMALCAAHVIYWLGTW